MDLFISWSGVRGKEIAKFLRQWVPDVIQSVRPWVSASDINAGSRWNNEIQNKLTNTKFGVICLTSDNLTAPWVLFEAGALAKTVEETYVCPYLLDISKSDIPDGPLTQFQAKSATKQETFELIKTMNQAQLENVLPDDQLQRTFERCWPELEREIERVRKMKAEREKKRSPDEMIEEILNIVRELRRVSHFPSLQSNLSELSAAASVASSLHDLGKWSPEFVQALGRVQRKKKDDDSDENA